MRRVEAGTRVRLRRLAVAGSLALGLGLVAMLAAANGEGATAILHSFAPDLRYPLSWLLADGAGYLYGTTNSGGYYESGALFKVKTDGTGFTLMHSFLRLSDGARPTSPLVADDLGNLYGMASEGGSARKGTVFTIRTDGSGFTVLHSFVGGSTDGRAPVAGLLLDGAGNLYGTTRFGGASDLGTVFTVRTDGSGFALLHSFADLPTEGTTPSGGLITDGAGSLFGVTSSGGASDQGTVFRLGTDGSGFTILHSFAGGAGDGASAGGGLFADGNRRSGAPGCRQGIAPADQGGLLRDKQPILLEHIDLTQHELPACRADLRYVPLSGLEARLGKRS